MKPNFFIVGAPKCGTTALYEYLRLHPNIFMSEVKEPHFFARDFGTYPRIKTLQAYNQIFAPSTEQHLRVGEASVYYLRSSVAIANIREFNPEAKLIAMFRNPVEMVHSFHSQLLYISEETVTDFETAWRLQDRRSRGLDLPPAIRSPLLVQYAEMGRFGTQAQRLLSLFPRHQVKLILYDDFAASPQRIYDEVIDFLAIPHDNRTEFPRINVNKRARMTWLRHFAHKPPPAVREVYLKVKHALWPEGLNAIKRKVVQLNTVKEKRAPLSPEFRAELVETFREEVALLSRLLNRDLSHWR
ncbi:MAG TPA: sulfotransferase domain-containing protein [Gemmatimonadales bacterium]|nr:sulfotransferase domain-containing protein [Gemmatimonadales bacterium]